MMKRLVFLLCMLLAQLSTAQDSAVWESQVRAFEEKDLVEPPPKGETVVVGSSSIRLWSTIRTDLSPAIVVPRGIAHRYRFTGRPARLLVIESAGFVRTPSRYRNEFGQLTENAPYSERDIRKPGDLQTIDQKGEFPIIVKKDNRLTRVTVDHHPFDVAGWDGFYYPWAFNINDFEPRVGRVHLPPPIHQTFEGEGFVVCSFCPRPFDFDPAAVPVPWQSISEASSPP
jgi:homogentisate 1,2-dioxygenase